MRLRPGSDLATFDSTSRECLDGMLASYGFVIDISRVEGCCGMRRYRNGHRYISVEIRTVKGEQPVGRVRLGTGTSEWPDSEWNQIPLWKLIKAKQASYEGFDYRVDNLPLRTVLEKIALDLQDYAMDFIAGELFTFKRLRAEAARVRPAFQAPGSGPYSEAVLKSMRVSKLLKEKYSNEAAA